MSTPVPQHCPTPRELDDLELLTSGAAGPIVGFNEPGSPITLALPDALLSHLGEGHEVELVDPEGLPLARLRDTLRGLSVEPLTHAQFGPFRRLHLAPDVAREQYAGRTVVPITDLVTDTQLDQLRSLGPVLLAALVGSGRPAVSPVGLLRACQRVGELLDAEVVAIPLTDHGVPEDENLRSSVLAWYAGADDIVELVEGGTVIPELADIAAQEHPAAHEQGLVLFFTGLSGSGKSTLARALMDQILEAGQRSLTSLDGDVVRRNLSAGLTFSKEDRETNIRRIGWVAAEIARHGGLAVCSPIAPFDETRQQVRAMVEEAGGRFFLIHVATPLEECERRDRKGLYAKARRGEIPEFTGISSPYEVPEDADVRVDTTGRTIEAALDDVVAALEAEGLIAAPGPRGASASDPGHRGASASERHEMSAQGSRDARSSLAGSSTTGSAAPAGRRGASASDPGRRGASASERHETPSPLRILFVCTANICRSPYMELRAKALTGANDRVEFLSAGTHGFRAHAVDATMAESLHDRGVDAELVDGFTSQRLTRELIASADLVLTAEASHREYVLEEAPAAFRKVFTLGQFAESVARLDPGLNGRALVTAVGHRRAGASTLQDIRDPFRRGRAAADASADQIDALFQAVLGRLTGPEADL